MLGAVFLGPGYFMLNLLLIIRNHKEVKSARDPIVGPPDRPGSRVHCPAPVLTRPLNPHHLVQIQRNKVDTFQSVG